MRYPLISDGLGGCGDSYYTLLMFWTILITWVKRLEFTNNSIIFSICRLDEHLIVSHNYPKDAFTCELCPKSYSYKPSLLRHRAIVHGEHRKYPCENCTKVGFTFIHNCILDFSFCLFAVITSRSKS